MSRLKLIGLIDDLQQHATEQRTTISGFRGEGKGKMNPAEIEVDFDEAMARKDATLLDAITSLRTHAARRETLLGLPKEKLAVLVVSLERVMRTCSVANLADGLLFDGSFDPWKIYKRELYRNEMTSARAKVGSLPVERFLAESTPEEIVRVAEMMQYSAQMLSSLGPFGVSRVVLSIRHDRFHDPGFLRSAFSEAEAATDCLALMYSDGPIPLDFTKGTIRSALLCFVLYTEPIDQQIESLQPPLTGFMKNKREDEGVPHSFECFSDAVIKQIAIRLYYVLSHVTRSHPCDSVPLLGKYKLLVSSKHKRDNWVFVVLFLLVAVKHSLSDGPPPSQDEQMIEIEKALEDSEFWNSDIFNTIYSEVWVDPADEHEEVQANEVDDMDKTIDNDDDDDEDLVKDDPKVARPKVARV